MGEERLLPYINNNSVKEWDRMRLLYDSALKEINTKLEILNQEFQLIYQYNPIEHVSSRIKSPESIAKKLRHNGRAITAENIIKYINDMAGIRIICSFTSDIYRLAELIAKQNDITVIKIKDYIKKPKENGYTSYHMIVSVPIFLTDGVVDTKVEIQIRTIAMDFWASLEHKMYYKFEGNAPANIRRELKECADLVAFLDRKMLALNEEIKKASGEDEDDSGKKPGVMDVSSAVWSASFTSYEGREGILDTVPDERDEEENGYEDNTSDSDPDISSDDTCSKVVNLKNLSENSEDDSPRTLFSKRFKRHTN